VYGPLGPPAWRRPIVLLTGPHAVSAAENFMQMLVGAHRLTAIVGEQRSAGTNGNITGVQLPGGFAFSYTGMRVLNPDGSRHHGVGIVPDVDTSLSAADLRDGVDRDLLAAIAVLGGP
jgi:C-terminal processing protease CtpA/Prc